MTAWQRRGATALVAFQVLVPVLLLVHYWPGHSYPIPTDAVEYQKIATTAAKPFATSEYPPAAVLLFKALGPKSFGDFLFRLVLVQVLAQAVTVACMFRVWGRRAGWSYLTLSAPLLPIVLIRFDLVAIAAAVAGAALITRNRRRVGGGLMALAAFVKVWPAVFLPSFAARREWRALAVGATVFVLGVAAWIAAAGTKGVRQVVTYRGARGWQIESVPGSLLYLFRRKTPKFSGGAWRVGAPSAVLSMALVFGLVVTVSWVWWTVARRGTDFGGLADLAAVSAVLTWSTLCSPQFIAWLLPWAAITGARGHIRAERTAFLVVILTVLAAATTTDMARPEILPEMLELGRNLALVALTIGCLRAVALHIAIPDAAATT